MTHLFKVLRLLCKLFKEKILQSVYQSIPSSYMIRIPVTDNEKLVSTYTTSLWNLYSNAGEICLRPATLIHLHRPHV